MNEIDPVGMKARRLVVSCKSWASGFRLEITMKTKGKRKTKDIIVIRV